MTALPAPAVPDLPRLRRDPQGDGASATQGAPASGTAPSTPRPPGTGAPNRAALSVADPLAAGASAFGQAAAISPGAPSPAALPQDAARGASTRPTFDEPAARGGSPAVLPGATSAPAPSRSADPAVRGAAAPASSGAASAAARPHSAAPCGAAVAAPAIAPSRAPTPEAPVPANDPRHGVPRRPFAARPRLALGPRIIPLGSFIWGAEGISHRPRVRGDAVLILIRSGEVRLRRPTERQVLRAGGLIFVPPGTAFSAHPALGAEGLVLLVPRPLTARLAVPLPMDLCAGVAQGAGAAALWTEAEALAELLRQTALAPVPDPTAEAAVLLRLGLVAVALHGLRLTEAAPPPRADTPMTEARALVTAYLDLAGRELGRGRTMADLAQALGTTMTGLDDACQRMRGRKALDLLYDLRIERAVALLRHSTDPLSVIAETTGFCSEAHLSRALVAATGRGPAPFRRRGG